MDFKVIYQPLALDDLEGIDNARRRVDVPRFWHGAQNQRSLQFD
jgi:hypothetical protein